MISPLRPIRNLVKFLPIKVQTEKPVLLLREVLLDVGQYLGGVLACVGDLEDFAHGAVLIDDERHSGCVAARAEHAERAGDLLLWVGEEWEVELLLVGELLLFGERVGADTDDDGVDRFERPDTIAKST